MLRLLLVLIAIESGGKNNAVGDGGKAVGCLQIHPIMVKECNRISGYKRWTLADRLSRRESMKMCSLYLSYQRSRHPNEDWATLGSRWNCKNKKYRRAIWKALKK